MFFLACCQILALYHFEGFFPFLLRQQPLTEPKLVPAFLFFSAAQALPLSPAVVVSPTARSSGLDLGSGYCAIFMVFFMERIFCTTEHISCFSTRKRQRLSNSLSISSISLRPFLSFSRYSLMNCFIISSQNTFARHPEAPRITKARSLVESVESSRCASILGISTSLTRAFLLLWHFFFSPHPHDALCGWKELCRVWCIGVYLARFWAWCQDCVFCPAAEFGEHDFIARHGQDLCHDDWATPEPKDCGHPLLLSTPSLVGLATIPCTLPLYFA